jgi:hypothetical protein
LALAKSHPSFASRVSRTFTLPTLTDDEAALMLAKKLLAKRLVENLDPLFPFDPEAVRILNKAAFGNPRRLLELADFAIERGVATRSYRIDADVVQAALESRIKSESGAGSAPPVHNVSPTAPPNPSSSVPVPAPSPTKPATRTVTPNPPAAAARPNYLED